MCHVQCLNVKWMKRVSVRKVTYVLVRDDLDVLHVSSGLENLPENLFGDPGVQTANVQSSFVGLGGSTPDGAASAHGRTKAVETVGIRHVHGERVVVLRDVEAERRLARHSLAVAILIARLARHATHGGRHGELRLGGTVVVGHYDEFAGVAGGRRERKSWKAELTEKRLDRGERGLGWVKMRRTNRSEQAANTCAS